MKSYDNWLQAPYQSIYNQIDADEEAIEWAEKEHGAYWGEHNGLHFFWDEKTGKGAFGEPHLEEDEDEDGKSLHVYGVTQCKVYKLSAGKLMFKSTNLVPSKRRSPKKWRGFYKEVTDQIFVI